MVHLRKSTRVTLLLDPTKLGAAMYVAVQRPSELSTSPLDLCRPKDEIEDLKIRSENTRTYSTSSLTPFEDLGCATILRPFARSTVYPHNLQSTLRAHYPEEDPGCGERGL